MILKHFAQAISIIGLAALTMAGTASATSIEYGTNTALTGFNNTVANSLSSSGGNESATLTFDPNVDSTTNTPSNDNYGNFDLVCAGCSTASVGTGFATFSAFSFNLIITDITDGATGEFVGTAPAGTVWTDGSNITVSWTPAQLGPGLNDALSGNFGSTSFNINTTTRIVEPDSNGGVTSVQGTITSASTPEPATLPLLGGGLIALSFFGRKKLSRRA